MKLPAPGELLARHGAERIAFGFDFDGTLVELQNRPEDVRFENEWKRALDQAARRHRTLICTGRGLSDLTGFLADPEPLDLIGNHGLEWRLRGQEGQSLAPSSWLKWRTERLPGLEALVGAHGGRIEDKGISLTLHYRGDGEAYWGGHRPELGPDVDVVPGKACWNIVARGASKGWAVSEYARRLGLERVVFFGDEPTDETVFELRTVDVLGIKVGEGPTAARYRVPDVASVRQWLLELSESSS